MRFLTQQLAEYMADLRFEMLPQSVVDAAKRCVLDCIGNMIYGRYSEMGKRILRYANTFASTPVSEPMVTMIGAGLAPKEEAVFAHTVMARCADLDDGHRCAMGHPGCVIVPTAISMTERYNRDGKELITALVGGYDIYARIGAAINPSSYRERGFDATGICGAIAAAAVVSKLSGGDAEEIKNAMGIASLFAGGLIEYQNDGTMGKVLCGGWAALTGIRAAQLAACSFTGPEAALEGKKGFFQAFSNQVHPECVLKDLGTDFRITGTYFKVHACMRGLHAAVDAILSLREENGLTMDEVKSIEVRTTPFVGRLSNDSPKTPVGAQCSLQFSMAVALKHGHLSSEELLVSSLSDSEVLAFARRIAVVIDEDIERYVEENPSHWSAVRVVVHTVDERKVEKWVPLPMGEPETPFDWETLTKKFCRMAENTPFKRLAPTLCGKIATLETVNSVSELLQLI